MGDNTFLNIKAAAAYLNKIGCPISYSNLRRLARLQQGPAYTKVKMDRTTIHYQRPDLDAWAAKNVTRIE